MDTAEWKTALEKIKISQPQPETKEEDEFLSFADMVQVKSETMERTLQKILAEVGEFFRQNRWNDVLSIIYPVEEKLPELVEAGLDTEIRAKAAFALGQLNRFDDALLELSVCVERDPDNFYHHSSLAYTAYNSLYAALNREIFLRGQPRRERIELAHKHFRKAQELRPDGITNFYREGMLYKHIEQKPEKSIHLFEKAIKNWESFDEKTKEARAQERKNYIKSLYQLASVLLNKRLPNRALQFLKKCIEKDEESNFVEPVFKYFALGKIYFHLNRFEEAKNALDFSLTCCNSDRPVDFIYELLARTLLAMDRVKEASSIIQKVPEKKRRPYYRWTEADILCAMRDFSAARRVLIKSAERDKRSKHKTLIRLARIEYLHGNFEKSRQYAREARKFFHETWGGILDDALFWEALNAYRLNDTDRALELALQLEQVNPSYRKLGLLLTRIREKAGEK